MVYTNNYNLPEAIVNTIGEPRKPVLNRISATDISGPAFIRRLKEERWDELTQDISDMIWLLFGNAMHYILQKGEPKQGLTEEKLEIKHNGYTIVGITDLWHNWVISDYKTTSVYSFLLGNKPEWTIQLNIYRWLYSVALDMTTDKLEIHAILRDWQKAKTYKDSDYPKIPFIIQDIPIVRIVPIVNQWLKEYENPVPCTPEQRWERPTTYACMKNENKTATRVFNTEKEAEKYIANQTKDKWKMVKREGEAIRCKTYCMVSQFCEYNPYKGATWNH